MLFNRKPTLTNARSRVSSNSTHLVGAGLAAALALIGSAHASAAERIAPKVMVITMFGEEAKPWLEARKLTTKIKVPGLSKEYPDVACDTEGLCVMTTAMGYANAASSTAALVLGDKFDLKQTYFLIDGIAGVDPKDGTLGSALWARYVIDGGLRHDIDPRQIPSDWPDGMLPLGAAKPSDKAGWSAGTEVYALNAKLAEKAFELTRSVELADGKEAGDYRARYQDEAARAKPAVKLCDTVSIDTYWHGSKIGDAMERWARHATDGKANYCTTQMEDNATLTALKRGADAGLLDFERIAVLRTASNFDREAPGQSAAESLSAKSGGFGPSVANAYRVGSAFADTVIKDWPTWSAGIK
ncbi:purine nucleoside permease [Labrys sp. WJW]|uniref:purine-nucleoside phosphorylase n=1 Tax=Labrys sp. WJW TaxID=1737983 RepID=UPI00082BCE7D|nr:purine nucleoside permease [Labrys sp. WJW]OCC04353.1 purine nucleoside permease [Labrys sp. WJW]